MFWYHLNRIVETLNLTPCTGKSNILFDVSGQLENGDGHMGWNGQMDSKVLIISSGPYGKQV